MKLKNTQDGIRALRDNGQVIEVGPGETIEVANPSYNKNAFEVINNQKSKEKKDSKTSDSIGKEELNTKEDK